MSREAWGATLALVALFLLTGGIALGRVSCACAQEPDKPAPLSLTLPPGSWPVEMRTWDMDGVERSFLFACTGSVQ